MNSKNWIYFGLQKNGTFTVRMQKRIQQLAGAALDTLGLSKIDDPTLVAYLANLDSIEVLFRYYLS